MALAVPKLKSFLTVDINRVSLTQLRVSVSNHKWHPMEKALEVTQVNLKDEFLELWKG